MDFYLNSENTYERLVREYRKHDSLTIAYDFDNTIFDYHGTGESYDKMIELLIDLHLLGCTLICYTAREDIEFVRNYCYEKGIPLDGVNENPKWRGELKGNSKMYYNILLDDRAGLKETYDLLTRLVSHMVQGKTFQIGKTAIGEGSISKPIKDSTEFVDKYPETSILIYWISGLALFFVLLFKPGTIFVPSTYTVPEYILELVSWVLIFWWFQQIENIKKKNKRNE